MLESERVYTFAGGQVKLANKRFTSIKNDYCITFDDATVVEACSEDRTIKADGYTFTSLESIEAMVGSQTIDVIGVILDLGSTGSINLKDGSTRDKRSLTIGDETNVSIGLTLWGEACEAHRYGVGQIIAFKACRISEYNGKSLNASWSPSDIVLNVKHPRALELAKW